MKRFAAGLLVVLIGAAHPASARAGVKLTLGARGEADLGVTVQALGRYTDFTNPDSNHARSGADAIVRRAWITLDGRYTDYLKFLLRAESVLNCNNCVAGSEDSNSARVVDAAVTVHYRDLVQLAMGIVKPPGNRDILTSDPTVLGIDRPGLTG